MSTRVLTFLALDSAGAPQGSLSPVFSSYLVDGSTPGGGAPAISAVSGATGLYSFTATLTAGQRLQAVIDLTASCTGQRYLAAAYHFDELFTPEATDTLVGYDQAALVTAVNSAVGYDQSALVTAIGTDLSTTHGSGQWGGGSGSGAQACAITVTVDGQARQGARVDVFAGGTIAAQAWTNASGVATVNLDAGTYTARVTSPSATWPTTTVVVTATDTITPSTLSGTGATSTATTPVGLSGSVSYTAPEYAGAIGPLAARDSWTITRDITALPANVSSAKFTIRAFGSPGTSLVDATVTVTDSTAPTAALSIAMEADDLALEGGRYAYDVELTLANGSVRTVEIGVITVTQHPSI